MTFEVDTGRFEATLVEGASVSKEQLEHLILAHGNERGTNYSILWGEPTAVAETSITELAQDFELPTLLGSRYALASNLGKLPIVVVFWASWCGPCLEEAPHLVELHQRYRGRVEFVSVSIDAVEDHGALKEVVDRLGIEYAVALDSDGTVLAKYASGGSIPLTFVMDLDGEVIHRHGNYEAGDELALADAIDRALATIR